MKQGVGVELNNDKLVFARFHFSVVLFCAFDQSRKKSNQRVKRGIKSAAELDWSWNTFQQDGSWGGGAIPYFDFQHGLCSNFPAISLGLEVGNCQSGFSGKLIRVRTVVHTWCLPGKMPAHYWEWLRVWMSLYIKQCFRVLTYKIAVEDLFVFRSSFTTPRSAVHDRGIGSIVPPLNQKIRLNLQM